MRGPRRLRPRLPGSPEALASLPPDVAEGLGVSPPAAAGVSE